ncbi:chloroplastic group IIA intron splicing facilitator CRS1, chloroplastic isoform X2 [Spinacia oleracea]|uniref:Chloroplastic group IIA intron splicing facilitator CRS1, chloroplastic isoform X2 n=1 Tax=Spinacia oleracea TaxID=3562 RepID=A0ABM3RML5_SPIOL|nr:chloroplastic group IIA intron splicing facilitator CRS1, chloroplastic isoform X2 [Spinacia oleracea]
MKATFFLSPSNIQLISTPFLDSFPSSPFSFPTKPLILKNPKPLNSLSSNASSFFLQIRSFNTKNSDDNINADDEISEDNNTNNNNNGSTISNSSNQVKMPTAPWMKSPLLLPPDEVLDLSKPNQRKKKISIAEASKADRSLTEKISGRKGKKVIKKIVHKIERLQTETNLVDTKKNWVDTQKNWDDVGGGFLLGDGGESKLARKLPWEKEEKLVFGRLKREKVVTEAELRLDEELLKRLRREASKMRKWVKVKKIGFSQDVVDEVHSIWANSELVMLNFDLPLCRNMDRAREIVEMKTGGLVVWSKKDNLVAYRGCDYLSRRWSRKGRVSVQPADDGQMPGFTVDEEKLDVNLTYSEQSYKLETKDIEKDSSSDGLLMDRNLGIKLTDRSLYEREGDRLLDGLGPRFVDWWYPKPLPVDGDLLPEVVPGFKPPFRLCPPRVRPQLMDDELTYLRKLARPLPVHFVLGRNSKLQGLAVAILKLWEKSVFAKIAVKWGVPNTNNEFMSSELKHLTGGVLLLRNKFFIVLYRGKDFLPGNVANAVIEREIELHQWQLHEEDARLKASGVLDFNDETSADRSIVGTFSEFQHIQTICRNVHHINNEAAVKIEAEKERLEKELRKQEHKLAILKLKIVKAEKDLGKLDSAWMSSEQEPDQELITEEERECFRKIGLKMDNILVLGRRGVFDGVIEGVHQHWKHRELVKVISMQRSFLQVLYTARSLERESGGILVCIEKLKKGHAIIIYRGKNYKRPIDFGGDLLNKRKALKRSLEVQRLGVDLKSRRNKNF